MQVNGEPKLTCKTALREYGGTVEVAPLANFPIVRDLVVELEGFLDKLQAREALDHRGQGGARAARAPTARRPRSSTRSRSSACASTACSATRPARWSRTSPTSSAPPRSRSATATTRTRATTAPPSATRCSARTAACSPAPSPTSAREVCPKHVDPGYAIQEAKLLNVIDWAKSFVVPREQAMSARARIDAMRPNRPGAHAHRAAAHARPVLDARPLPAPTSRSGAAGCLICAVALRHPARRLGARRARSGRLAGAPRDAIAHPLVPAFHAFALVALTWFGLRFFRLFPKTQPARIGPLSPPPPDAASSRSRYGAFVVARRCSCADPRRGAAVKDAAASDSSPLIWMLFGGGMMVDGAALPGAGC